MDEDDSDQAWNRRQRDETELQRLDRNLNELLQELRVAQTGVQILFAFLLTPAFTQRFGSVTAFQRGVDFVTLLLATVATSLLVALVSARQLLCAAEKAAARRRHQPAGHQRPAHPASRRPPPPPRVGHGYRPIPAAAVGAVDAHAGSVWRSLSVQPCHPWSPEPSGPASDQLEMQWRSCAMPSVALPAG